VPRGEGIQGRAWEASRARGTAIDEYGSQGVGELQEAWTADKERMTEGNLETSNAGGFVARCSLAVLKEKVLVDVEAASGEVAHLSEMTASP